MYLFPKNQGGTKFKNEWRNDGSIRQLQAVPGSYWQRNGETTGEITSKNSPNKRRDTGEITGEITGELTGEITGAANLDKKCRIYELEYPHQKDLPAL